MRKLFFILLFTSTFGFSQTQVTGKVQSSNGDVLPGVSVLEKDTNNGTITNFDGDYSITIGSSAVLVFSYVGFETKEVPINSRTKIDIVLSDIETLDEIVVTGTRTLLRYLLDPVFDAMFKGFKEK